MALTKAQVEADIKEIDEQLAQLDAQELAYKTGTIDDGKTGGPPVSPTLEEFLETTATARADLKAAKSELETIRDTQDFSILTGS